MSSSNQTLIMDNTSIPIFRRYDSIKLPENERDQILLEIGEHDESREKSLEDLTKMLKAQSTFQPCLHPDFLMRFLRCSKFNCSKAFSRIQKFYSIQNKYPDYFELCVESALVKSEFIFSLASPFRMKDNSLLFITKFYIRDVSKLSIKEKFHLDTLVLDKIAQNPVTQMCGVTYIVDVCDISLSTLLHYRPSFFKLQIESIQGANPIRIKGIHMVNTPTLFKVIYNIAYPLLTKKLQERVHVHPNNDNWRSLHSYIPPEILPEEYGGYLQNSSMVNFLEDVREMENDFRKHSPFLHANQNKF